MSIRTAVAALAITGLLALPASALAGGWATVQLSSTPDGLKPGAVWNVELQILQHGRTPLRGIHPTVTISAGDVSRTFAARPGDAPGAYRASVRFGAAGTWRYVVDDGFTARHSYPPVRIGAAAAVAAAPPGREVALDRLALAGLVGLAAGACALVLPRGRARRRAAALGGGG